MAFGPTINLGNGRERHITSTVYSDGVARKKTGWYGVRTLVRLIATGRPKKTDKHFDPMTTLVEDRVVLFRADSFDSAIEKAEKEAQQYCRRTRFTNIYGQSVRMKFLRMVDAFSMLDHEPVVGSEVYSSTTLVARSVSDAKLIAQRYGDDEEPTGGEPV
jgi:Domain of unknown function (DUF4288)